MSARMPARGFSLVEVLVAMVVLALGLLALAGLVQSAIRHAAASASRATAALLADDLADRLRANPAGAALAAQGYEFPGTPFGGPPAPASVPCTHAAPCGPSALASFDLAQWTARVRAALPKGSARVALHGAAPPAAARAEVWVGWADPLARSPAGVPESPSAECPADWTDGVVAVRCVYLQVAL